MQGLKIIANGAFKEGNFLIKGIISVKEFIGCIEFLLNGNECGLN